MPFSGSALSRGVGIAKKIQKSAKHGLSERLSTSDADVAPKRCRSDAEPPVSGTGLVPARIRSTGFSSKPTRAATPQQRLVVHTKTPHQWARRPAARRFTFTSSTVLLACLLGAGAEPKSWRYRAVTRLGGADSRGRADPVHRRRDEGEFRDPLQRLQSRVPQTLNADRGGWKPYRKKSLEETVHFSLAMCCSVSQPQHRQRRPAVRWQP